MSDIDDFELDIQRCVDGQLSEADQQALLRRLQSSPEGWRRLSLAFVENQVWSQTIQRTSPKPFAPPAPAPVVRRDFAGAWGKVIASMAAGVLGGVILHGQMGSVPNEIGTGGAVAATGNDSQSGANSGDPASPRPSASGRSVAVPTQLASDRPGTVRILPDEVRQQLQRSGYPVDQGQMYYSLRLPDGTQYIVPVNTVRFRNAEQ